MAWRWLAQAVEEGVVVDPRDFVRNENELAQEFGGYFDRDNVGPEQVTPAKPVAQAFVLATSNPQEGSPLQTLPAGQTGIWVEITDMTTTADVREGEVIVDADVSCNAGSAYISRNNLWQARMTINGVPCAYTGWVQFNRLQTCVSMTGSAPVQTGSVSVQVQVRMWGAPFYHLTDLNNGVDWAVLFNYNLTQSTGDLQVLAGNVVIINRIR